MGCPVRPHHPCSTGTTAQVRLPIGGQPATFHANKHHRGHHTMLTTVVCHRQCQRRGHHHQPPTPTCPWFVRMKRTGHLPMPVRCFGGQCVVTQPVGWWWFPCTSSSTHLPHMQQPPQTPQITGDSGNAKSPPTRHRNRWGRGALQPVQIGVCSVGNQACWHPITAQGNAVCMNRRTIRAVRTGWPARGSL